MVRHQFVKGYCESSPHGPEGCANAGRYRTATGKLACGRHTYGERVTNVLTGEVVRGLGRSR